MKDDKSLDSTNKAIPTEKKEMVVGDYKLMNNQIAFVLLRRPAYKGLIIIPDQFQDTSFMSQVVYVLGKGPGYRKKRKSSEFFAEGTKQWKSVVEDIDQADSSLHYVGDVKVNNWHFLKHPFVRDQGIWIKNLFKTHSHTHEFFDTQDVKFERGTMMHRIFLTCASEVLLKIELEDGESIDNLYEIKRGEMMSIS